MIHRVAAGLNVPPERLFGEAGPLGKVAESPAAYQVGLRFCPYCGRELPTPSPNQQQRKESEDELD